MKSPAVVVDTNVGIVANDLETTTSLECVIACVDYLQDITDGNIRLVLDSGWEILEEYQRNLSSTGQPGPGDVFLKWVLQNQANPKRCETVDIHEDAARGYEEFPADPALEAFDRDDRKFVAVALTSPSEPEIVNAVDSDWWIFREPLKKNGLRIRLVCPDQIDGWKEKIP